MDTDSELVLDEPPPPIAGSGARLSPLRALAFLYACGQLNVPHSARGLTSRRPYPCPLDGNELRLKAKNGTQAHIAANINHDGLRMQCTTDG